MYIKPAIFSECVFLYQLFAAIIQWEGRKGIFTQQPVL